MVVRDREDPRVRLGGQSVEDALVRSATYRRSVIADERWIVVLIEDGVRWYTREGRWSSHVKDIGDRWMAYRSIKTGGVL